MTNASLSLKNWKLIAVCAALAVFFQTTGFMGLLYAAPVGFALYYGGRREGLFASVTAIALNLVVLLGFVVFASPATRGAVLAAGLRETAFFMLALAMLLLVDGAPEEWQQLRFFAPSAVVTRFTVGAAIFGLSWAPLFFVSSGESLVDNYLQALADSLNRGLGESAVDAAYLRNLIKTVAERGGMLLWGVFFLGLNRIFALWTAAFAARFRAKPPRPDFAPFATYRASSLVLLVFTIAFFAAGISVIAGFTGLALVAWNLLAFCAFLFVVQGWGAARFLLLQRFPRGARLAGPCIVIVALLVPAFIPVGLLALLVLGIIDHFVNFRQ
jgi:hypothetical protein